MDFYEVLDDVARGLGKRRGDGLSVVLVETLKYQGLNGTVTVITPA